jgi:hypothetical protein
MNSTYLKSARVSLAALVAGFAGWLCALFPASVAAAPVAKGTCQPTAVGYIVSRTSVTTTSTTLVPVAETRVNFTQGGSKASCVIVSFSAGADNAGSETSYVSAILDNKTECNPADDFFVSNNAAAPGLRKNAMSYVCPSVAPGPHFAAMYYRSAGGQSVTLYFRTTLVHYVK